MKRVTSIFLIMLMSLQIVYNAGVVTYFQLNREFIARVHCVNKEKPTSVCQGQCFLKKNLDPTGDDTSGATAPETKVKTDLSVFLVCEHQYYFANSHKSRLVNHGYIAGLSSAHVPKPFHPPAMLSSSVRKTEE